MVVFECLGARPSQVLCRAAQNAESGVYVRPPASIFMRTQCDTSDQETPNSAVAPDAVSVGATPKVLSSIPSRPTPTPEDIKLKAQKQEWRYGINIVWADRIFIILCHALNGRRKLAIVTAFEKEEARKAAATKRQAVMSKV